MKLKKLIKRLQKLEAKHGSDMMVVLSAAHGQVQMKVTATGRMWVEDPNKYMMEESWPGHRGDGTKVIVIQAY